jgi:hypothetical protein
VLRFCPYPDAPVRSITAYAMGRRAPASHVALLERARRDRSFFYLYDSASLHELVGNVYLGEEFPGIQYLAAHAAFRRPKRVAMLIHNVASLRRSLPLATLGLARFADHLL